MSTVFSKADVVPGPSPQQLCVAQASVNGNQQETILDVRLRYDFCYLEMLLYLLPSCWVSPLFTIFATLNRRPPLENGDIMYKTVQTNVSSACSLRCSIADFVSSWCSSVHDGMRSCDIVWLWRDIAFASDVCHIDAECQNRHNITEIQEEKHGNSSQAHTGIESATPRCWLPLVERPNYIETKCQTSNVSLGWYGMTKWVIRVYT